MDRRSVYNWYNHRGYRHPEKGDGPHHHGPKGDLPYGLGEAVVDQDQGHHGGEDLLAHEVTDVEGGVVQIQQVQDNKRHSYIALETSVIFCFFKKKLCTIQRHVLHHTYILFTYKNTCIVLY